MVVSNSEISSLYFSFSFFCITNYLTRSSRSFSWVLNSCLSSAFFLIRSLFSLSILYAIDVISSKLCCISFSRSFRSPSWSPLCDFWSSSFFFILIISELNFLMMSFCYSWPICSTFGSIAETDAKSYCCNLSTTGLYFFLIFSACCSSDNSWSSSSDESPLSNLTLSFA